jgi:hypothetical protein
MQTGNAEKSPVFGFYTGGPTATLANTGYYDRLFSLPDQSRAPNGPSHPVRPPHHTTPPQSAAVNALRAPPPAYAAAVARDLAGPPAVFSDPSLPLPGSQHARRPPPPAYGNAGFPAVTGSPAAHSPNDLSSKATPPPSQRSSPQLLGGSVRNDRVTQPHVVVLWDWENVKPPRLNGQPLPVSNFLTALKLWLLQERFAAAEAVYDVAVFMAPGTVATVQPVVLNHMGELGIDVVLGTPTKEGADRTMRMRARRELQRLSADNTNTISVSGDRPGSALFVVLSSDKGLVGELVAVVTDRPHTTAVVLHASLPNTPHEAVLRSFASRRVAVCPLRHAVESTWCDDL